MLVYHLFGYKFMIDPAYGIEFLNDIWAREPVGALSICITLTGLLITLAFKLFDFWWDVQKERARQGKLKLELSAANNTHGLPVLQAIISNIGREPVVIREVGYAKPRLFGKDFVPVTPVNTPLPHALNAHELMQLTIDADTVDLQLLTTGFQVKDSLGNLWEAPERETRRAKRQLNVLQAQKSQKKQRSAEKEEVVSLN